MIRGSLPDGLAQMRPHCDYLKMLQAFDPPQGTAFAGTVDDGFQADAYGLEFLRGFAGQAFGNFENDLVVGRDSAGAGFQTFEQVASDHFSYLLQDDVTRRIGEATRALRGQPGRLVAEDPP